SRVYRPVGAWRPLRRTSLPSVVPADRAKTLRRRSWLGLPCIQGQAFAQRLQQMRFEPARPAVHAFQFSEEETCVLEALQANLQTDQFRKNDGQPGIAVGCHQTVQAPPML